MLESTKEKNWCGKKKKHFSHLTFSRTPRGQHMIQKASGKDNVEFKTSFWIMTQRYFKRQSWTETYSRRFTNKFSNSWLFFRRLMIWNSTRKFTKEWAYLAINLEYLILSPKWRKQGYWSVTFSPLNFTPHPLEKTKRKYYWPCIKNQALTKSEDIAFGFLHIRCIWHLH